MEQGGFFQCAERGDTVPVLELLVQLLCTGFLQARWGLGRIGIRRAQDDSGGKELSL